MSVEQASSKPALSKVFMNLQDRHYVSDLIMDVRTTTSRRKTVIQLTELRKLDYSRSFSQGFFTLESIFLLVCLTVSLLILPLVLPPLPPPPFLLLMLPICILGLLMILAFMLSNVRDVTYV